MHNLLKRQLKKYVGENSPLTAELQTFVDSIDRAYRQFDEDREMLERSLELSSQELLQANSEMRATLQAFPDLFFSVDHQGAISNVKAGRNVNVLRKYADYLGKKIQDIPSKDIAEKFSEALAQVVATRELVRIEYKLNLTHVREWSGEDQFFEARLLPITDKQIFVIIRNITESKRAQLALVEEKERLAVTLRSIVDGVVTTDTDGRIIMMNKAMEEMVGWKQHDAVGRHCTEIVTLVGARDNAPLEGVVEQAFKNKAIVHVSENLLLISRSGKKEHCCDQRGSDYGP